MKMNKLFTLAVTMLLSTVTVVSCGNKASSSQAISSEAAKTSEPSSKVEDSSSSTSSEEKINYGTKDAPISALAAVAILTAATNNTFVDTPFYIQAYVIAVEDGKYYIADKKDETDRSFVIENATVATGVNTPVVGSKITVTGYGKRYHNADETGMIYTLTTNGTTSPSIIYSDAAAVVNYGTKDAPLTIAEAKMLCDAAGDNTVSTTPLFVTGYVVSISDKSSYDDYTIWISSTSTGEKEFELYGCKIADDVNTPKAGSKVIATGYYEKYVSTKATTYELTHTTIEGTKINPTIVWSDAEAPAAVNYGSSDSPLTVAGAKAIATSTASTEDCYVTGYVSSITAGTDSKYTIELSDAEDGATTFTFYYGTLDEGIDTPVIGDNIVIKGKLIYFNNYKYEITDGSVIKLTKGTKTYAVTSSIVDSTGVASTNATISGLPTENILPGTSVTFTVTPATGYAVDSVKYNGSDIAQNTDGSYTFSSNYSNAISVVVIEDTGEVKFKLNAGTLGITNTQYASTATELSYTTNGKTYKFQTEKTSLKSSDNGDSIQLQKTNGYIYNTTAFDQNISKVEIVLSADHNNSKSNVNISFSATAYTAKATKYDAQFNLASTSYTVTCTTENAKYICITGTGGACYISNIIITFATADTTTTPAE
jgi:hypothetical protein